MDNDDKVHHSREGWRFSDPDSDNLKKKVLESYWDHEYKLDFQRVFSLETFGSV